MSSTGVQSVASNGPDLNIKEEYLEIKEEPLEVEQEKSVLPCSHSSETVPEPKEQQLRVKVRIEDKILPLVHATYSNKIYFCCSVQGKLSIDVGKGLQWL